MDCKLVDSDVAGSPRSIDEYRVPDALGGEVRLQSYRQRLHAHGMKLLLDFVPNHAGLDHRRLVERPELFVQGPVHSPGTFEQKTGKGVRWLAYGRDTCFAPWTDTLQPDYRHPETRAAMLGQLLEIAARSDGVRCDMAMLVLSDVFERTWQAFPPVPPAVSTPGLIPNQTTSRAALGVTFSCPTLHQSPVPIILSIMLDWSSCPEVERLPEKVSGSWLFTGTRVPVVALFENVEGGAAVDDFLNWFPGVARKQVEAVLEFAAQSLLVAHAG